MRLVLRIVGGLLLLIVLVLAWPWGKVAGDSFTQARYVEWLENHKIVIDLDTTDYQFDLGSDVYGADIFILGEVHGVADLQRLDFSILRNVHEKAGVRYYLAEMDPAQASAVNAFLDSGDETLIQPIFAAWRAEKAQWANQEFFEKLKKVRQWNNLLSYEDRITFVGVDRIHDHAFAQYALGQFGSKSDAAIEKALADYDEEKPRYTVIMENIELFRSANPDAKAYGLWGVFHVLKVPVNGVKTLSLRLEESGLFDGVITFAPFYVASEMMMPSGRLPEQIRDEGDYTAMPFTQDFPYLFYVNGINDLKKAAGNADTVLFRMAGDDIPYAGSDRLRNSSGFIAKMQPLELGKSNHPTTDFIMLIRNSPALTPYDSGQ